jgi:hypothetical protein
LISSDRLPLRKPLPENRLHLHKPLKVVADLEANLNADLEANLDADAARERVGIKR